MQRDLLLNAIVRIQKSCPDKTKCQDKHHITAVFFSSVSNWRKSFFLVKMHFRYAMPDVLIFFQFLCFFYFGTIFVWRLQYCAAPIHYADNFIWKLAFAFSKVGINLSDVKVLLMEKGWICKTLFHFADFTRWLREYSEQWKICWIQWKDFDWEKMEKNDSLSAHLIFRARGSDEHFLLTRTQLHTGEGRAPSLSFKCSGNIWSGINIWCTYRVIIQDL